MGNFNDKKSNEEEPVITRAPLPKKGEIMGVIEQRLGGNRMMVNCLDNKKRNCRVPGRLRRKLWLRPNDVVIVQPWESDDAKGDLLFKYRPNQIVWLKNQGYLKTEKSTF
jgi:translation initiation factor 1A